MDELGGVLVTIKGVEKAWAHEADDAKERNLGVGTVVKSLDACWTCIDGRGSRDDVLLVVVAVLVVVTHLAAR